MIKNEKVVLYHPSLYLGGSEVLFARVACLLLDHGYEVHLVDHDNGATRKALGSRCAEIFFHGYGLDTFYRVLEDGGVLIASAVNILRFYNEVPSGCQDFKVLFWVLHPAEVYAQIGIGYDKVKKVFGYDWLRWCYAINPLHIPFERLLTVLNASHSLYFMDAAVLAETEWVTKKKLINPQYLRLVTGLESAARSVNSPSTPNRYLVISRLDSFKVAGLVKFITDMNRYAHNDRASSFIVDVIGDGAAETELRALAATSLVEFNFLGHLTIDRIRSVIFSGAYTCLFAMGMSILEGASAGLPVVLLPASEGFIVKDDCYVVVSSESDVLGEYFESPAKRQNYQSLPAVLDLIKKDWEASSDKVLDFFINFYSSGFGALEGAVNTCVPTSRNVWGENRFLRLARYVYAWRASRIS